MRFQRKLQTRFKRSFNIMIWRNAMNTTAQAFASPLHHEGTYHAPVYEPTVDELEILKKLELGEDVSQMSAAREYLSKRLIERGLVEVDAERHWHITLAGRSVIRRQE